MNFDTTTPARTQVIEPMNITITLETADDFKWFYHLMNQDAAQIKYGYNVGRLGAFARRFTNFVTPDKNALFKAVKAAALSRGIQLKL